MKTTESIDDTEEQLQDGSESLERFPRRDYLVLPLLSVLTLVVMFVGAEIATRMLWPEGGTDVCAVYDPMTGFREKPNCTALLKSPESPWVAHTFNNCGYRTVEPCGPKPPRAIRIALLGSSIAEGYLVPYSDTFAVVAAGELRRLCHGPVEVQNLAAPGSEPIYAYHRIDEALALQADAIMLAINPYDVEVNIDPKLLASRNSGQPIPRASAFLPVRESTVQKIERILHQSRTVIVVQHFMLPHRDFFLQLYSAAGGDHTAFLNLPLPPAWQKRFGDLDLLLGEMAAKAHAAGLPFLLLGIPERAEAVMLSATELPRGIDPYAFNRKLSGIAAKHGIIYLDVFNDFKRAPHPETLFYPADGHLGPQGHLLVGHAIARSLMETRIPVLSSCGVR